MKIEIAKSIAMKVNIGNYQSLDFFCSVKAETEESKRTEVGEKLHGYCKEQVLKDLNGSLKYLATKVEEEKKKQLLEEEL